MTKLNKSAKAEDSKLREHPDATTNKEGGLAFKMNAESELYSRVLCSLWGEPKYYEDSGAEEKNAIQELVKSLSKTNPEFVLQLAAYARNDMNLRTVPQVLLVEACAYPETKQFVRRYTPSVIRRADELAEVVAYYRNKNGNIGNADKHGMLSNPLKRGIADAFHQFDAYQLAKYDRNGPVKLRDVLRICHPKWQDEEQHKMWGMLKERTLPAPETWEVELSTKGSSKESWERILPKMNFMALLRNLRNFIDKGVDVTPVLEKLTDPEQIKKSKQFPFRFWSAYVAIADAVGEDAGSYVSKSRRSHKIDHEASHAVMDAMQTALELSVDNVSNINGTSFVSADNSGSMDSPISQKSTVKMYQVANLLQAMTGKICDKAITSVFGEIFKVVHAPKADGCITNMMKFRNTGVGHSTNAYLTIKWLNDEKKKVDRIIIFSDMQCYSTSGGPYGMPGYGARGQSLAEQFETYRKNVNPGCYLYSVDLAGYGTAQFPDSERHVVLLAGWNEKLLDFINKFESGGADAISFIKTTKPRALIKPKSWFSKPKEDKEIDENHDNN